MTSLRDFQNGLFIIDKSEHIFCQKFEDFFNEIHNGINVINFSPRREDTNEMFKKLIESIRNTEGGKLILSINGDTDIPCIKKEYLLQDSIPYRDELQKHLENLPLEYFIEGNSFENIPPNVNVYCHSVIKKSPQINMIPLGRDFKGKHILENYNFEIKLKDTLCYYNCSVPPMSIHWYGRIRSYIYEGLLNSGFVKIEHVDVNQNRDLGFYSFLNYYNKISNSKFMICPRGCAIDTYRLWDCLYLGCIPIVVKYEGYQDFEDLPILFIDEWTDYLRLDENYLNQKYLDMLDMEYNYDKLTFSWWKNRILSDYLHINNN